MTTDYNKESVSQDSVSEEFPAWMDQIPGVDPRVEAASQRMRRIARLFGHMLVNIAAEYELSVGDWESLSVLQRSGPPQGLSQKELAEELGVTSGTMSVRIERLTRAGFVEPGTPRADGRNRPVRLTTKGRELWRSATGQRTAQEQHLLADTLSAEEIEHLNLLLGRVLTRLEGEFGPAPSHGSLRRETG